MNLETCLKKMELVGVLAFATVDSEGAPQIRNISAIHYEPQASISSPPEEKISAASCWRTAGCRYYVIQNIKK